MECEIHILLSKSETCQYIMVAADDNADGAVRTVVGIAQRIVFVLVRFETEFVKTMLQTLMKRYGIGAKRGYLSLAIDLKVEMLAGEIIVVVRVTSVAEKDLAGAPTWMAAQAFCFVDLLILGPFDVVTRYDSGLG